MAAAGRGLPAGTPPEPVPRPALALVLALVLLLPRAALAWGGGDRFFSPDRGALSYRVFRSGPVYVEARVQGLSWTAAQVRALVSCAQGRAPMLPAVELRDLSGHLSASGEFCTNLPAPLWKRLDPGGDRRWERAVLVCQAPWKLEASRPYFLRITFYDWDGGSQGRLEACARQVRWGFEASGRWEPVAYADLYDWLDEVAYDCSRAAPADPSALPDPPWEPNHGEKGVSGEPIGELVLDLPEAGARLRLGVTDAGSVAALVDLDLRDREAVSRYLAYCRAQARRLAESGSGLVPVALTFRRPLDLPTVRELLQATGLEAWSFVGRGPAWDGSPVSFGVHSDSDAWVRLLKLRDRLEAGGIAPLGVTGLSGQVVASPMRLGRLLDFPELAVCDIMEAVAKDRVRQVLGLPPQAEVSVSGNRPLYWVLEDLGLPEVGSGCGGVESFGSRRSPGAPGVIGERG
ncbi:MAG: hypothetical protein K6T75_00175 [Acetobacteraceae bacterium]|nr:hypothetical protein [Acetobacteraceae bacterium]